MNLIVPHLQKDTYMLNLTRRSFLFTACSLAVLALGVARPALAKDIKLKAGDRVVFLGDSITQAGVAPDGYVTLVKNEIASKLKDQKIEVIGAGISGNRVPDLQNRLEKDVIAQKPSIVVIYIGINDVWHSMNGRGTKKEDFKSGLTSIIKRLKEAGSQVLLCTASVIGEKTDGSNMLDEMLDEYCDISREVAKETDSSLIDLRKQFLTYLKKNNKKNAEKDQLTSDGVHLNAAGNRFVADCMLEALGVTAGDGKKKLRHFVVFKFKSELKPEQVEEVVKAFAALPGKIDTITDFEMGTDVSVEMKADGYTHAFMVTFADEKGRETYLPHPAHQEFVKLVGPRIEKVFVFDYWAK